MTTRFSSWKDALDWSCKQLSVKDIDPQIYERIETMYGNRAYHNLLHVESCLKDLQAYANRTRMSISALASAVIAFIFHDIISDLKDDKLSVSLSAAYFLNMFKKMPFLYKENIRLLILSTGSHDLSTDMLTINGIESLIHDIDHSILSSDKTIYDEYCRNIRKEALHDGINEIDFIRGRIKFILNKLGGNIYYNYDEHKARINMIRELNALKLELKNMEKLK